MLTIRSGRPRALALALAALAAPLAACGGDEPAPRLAEGNALPETTPGVPNDLNDRPALEAQSELDDAVQTGQAVAAAEGTNAVREMNELLQDEPADLVGRPVEIDDARVTGVAPSGAFFVGAAEGGPRVLVVPAGANAADGTGRPEPGASVSLRGRVEPFAAGAPGLTGLAAADLEAARGRGLVVRATAGVGDQAVGAGEVSTAGAGSVPSGVGGGAVSDQN